MDATTQLKEMLRLSQLSANCGQKCGPNGSQYGVNDLNASHNLPNNCTIRVNSSSTCSTFDISLPMVAIEGRESTNSYFAKIERLVEFNWKMISNVNLIAVNNRKPLIAYVLNVNHVNRRSYQSSKSSPETVNNQMIRVLNYDNRHRCLAKDEFHSQIADLSFAINSFSSNSLDLMKLAIADREGNIYIYNIKEDNTEISAHRVLEIKNNGLVSNYVKLSWCPYISTDEDETEVEGDMGLKLALSRDTCVELFAIDAIQDIYKNTNVIQVSTLKGSANYQIIENAHKQPIISLSIAQDMTAICTTGLDDSIKFYKISLSCQSNASKMLKEWVPNYLEPDDHINCFYFLDDFDFLLANSDQTFWGHALIGTKNGNISVVDLKDWRRRQSIKLMCKQLNKSKDGFNYKIDLTSHFVVAVRDNAAFILHIKFPHDKEEQYDDCNDKINCDIPYDNSYPHISKVSRFQIYNAPLLSFSVKKTIDGNILVFWITSKSLELCFVDLSLINVEEFYESSYDLMSSSNSIEGKADANSINIFTSNNNSDNNMNTTIDLLTGTNANDFNCFDSAISSIISPAKASLDPQIKPIPPPLPTVETLAALNMPLNLNLYANEVQTRPRSSQQIRAESPASEEVQQILSPSSALKSVLSGAAINNSLLMEENEFSQTDVIALSGEATADATFPNKLPNILKDLVREEQLSQLKDDIRKEMNESEKRIIQYLEKMDQKISIRFTSNYDQMFNNNKLQTIKLETDIREMKKELKNACKIRNEEFNKIVEKLVNKVMHEMNAIVQKGFQELMLQLDREVKQVTASFERSVSAMNATLATAHDKINFQPLNLPIASSPMNPMAHQSNYSQPRSPTSVTQRKTPQQSINTNHSMQIRDNNFKYQNKYFNY